MIRLAILALLSLFISACTGLPAKVEPVGDFDAKRYLGRWYEVARLDHPFERGLTNVTAEYSLREDGGLRIVNQGYAGTDDTPREAEGKAYFVGSPDVGHLKVSFFGPFYASYVVFDLDREHYRHAFVAGYSEDSLWLLSRTPQVDEGLKKRFVDEATARGFDTSGLIWVDQSRHVAPDTPVTTSLTETYWKLIWLGDTPVTPLENQQEAHLVLHTQDHRAAGFAGCNRFTGTYELDGTALRFGPLATTRMACASGMDVEQRMLEALHATRSWNTTGEHLELSDDHGALLARFEAVAPRH